MQNKRRIGNKYSWKIVILLLLSALFLLFAIPHFINKAYDIGGFYETNWGAGDVLSFYGSVLGGFATLMAIYITIRRENRIRRYDEQKQKNEVKIQYVRNSLNSALHTLDCSHIVITNIPHSDPSSAIEKLRHYSLEVRNFTTIEVLFDIEQSEILREANLAVKSYAENYYSLITDFINFGRSHTEYKLYMSYDEILKTYRSDPEKYYNEIKKVEQQMEEIYYKDLNQIDKENEKVRMEIVNFSNEKYNSMYDVVIKGIKQLEQFYETQLEAIK